MELEDDPSEPWNHLDPDEFRHVIAYGPELAAHDAETDFEFGLGPLIGVLEALPRRPAEGAGPDRG